MPKSRCNITISELIRARAEEHCHAHEITFSRLVEEALTIYLNPDRSSQELTEILTIVTDIHAIISLQGTHTILKKFDDSIGLERRLTEFMQKHNMTNILFKTKYGIDVTNRSKWRGGMKMNNYTAMRILEILDSDTGIQESESTR